MTSSGRAMDKRDRQAQLPIEPIYCAAPQEAHDILCPGSDDELDEPARLAKRLRYEEQGLRYLEGRPPRLTSASLRGPFDRGWQNPWLPKHRNTKSSISRPAVPRPAVKSIAPKALARLPGSKNATPMTGDSMQCHLPSPESNREVQLDDHAGLDSEKRFLIHDWAKGIPSDALDRDEFWAPSPGSGGDPHSNSKKRPAASDWLKSKLTKRKISHHDAPSPIKHTPTAAAALVQASTTLNPNLPITSPKMTTPSSSTGLCSAKSMGKALDPVSDEEDTGMPSDSASSMSDESQACASRQDAAGAVVDTNAPRRRSPEPSKDHRQTAPERSEVGEAGELCGADIAFESQMDDSFHYRVRPIARNVARSASPILKTIETGAQQEQMGPFGLEKSHRSKSCDVQEPTPMNDNTRQDYRFAAIPERTDDMAEELQGTHPNATTSYQRALSLPPQLCPEGYTARAELDAAKRAKSSGPEHRPEIQHESATFRDNGAFLVPIGDIRMPNKRDPVTDQTNTPVPALAEEVAATPKSSHADEAEGAQDVQTERPSNQGMSANSTETHGIEFETFKATHSTSLEKFVSGGDTTLVGDTTHSGNEPHKDAYSHAPAEPSVFGSLSGRPEVDVMTEIVYSATQMEPLARGAVPGPTAPPPERETVLIQDVAQETPENGSDIKDAAAHRTIVSIEPGLPEQTAGSPARLLGHIEERHKTPDLDEHGGERESLEERSWIPHMDERTGEENRLEERPKTADLNEHTGGEDCLDERPRTPDVDRHTGEEEAKGADDDLIPSSRDIQHITEADAQDLQSEPGEGWVAPSRHMTPTSTPTPCQGQCAIGISQQTPWTAIVPDAPLELELSVKSFAKFNTPSPKPSHRSYRHPRLSGGRLPSTPLFFDVTGTNPWTTGQSQSSRRGSRRGTRRVSFAPLPGEEEAVTEPPSFRSNARPKSPPPSLDTQVGGEDLDDQFSGHFDAVRRCHEQEPKTCLQRLLPAESQQQLSPGVNAMAIAFREADAYHNHILEDCPTTASGFQKTVEKEEEDDDEGGESPQSPWQSDTQTLALDPVAAVLQNLDDFLNPRWDTEAPRKLARCSGGIDCLEDQENRGIQIGLDGTSIWETA